MLDVHQDKSGDNPEDSASVVDRVKTVFSPHLGIAPPQISSADYGSSDILPGRCASSGLHTECASTVLQITGYAVSVNKQNGMNRF
ncbi:hypothetical protein Pcaca05_39420 [Pectobacterium carotovorum subsp. carotovorum]|nr:hypothetical protein Pcaca05_39420 [Pectobacterium carotovorum subsp. carotovorum]